MADRIAVNDRIALDAAELDFSYIRSSGPGGQNVNKVASAAQLRFDLKNSPNLHDAMKKRAARLAGRKLTQDGVIVITASTHRTQVMNREDAISRLVTLLEKAAEPPKHRKKTRPTLASKRRRLDAKTKRGTVKSLRQNKPPTD